MKNQKSTTKSQSDQPFILFKNSEHKLRSKDIRYVNLVMIFAKYIETEAEAIRWYFNEAKSITIAKRLLAENNWRSIDNITIEHLEIWFKSELNDMKNILYKMLEKVS